MKVHATYLSSSRAVQIVANETGLPLELVNVDLKALTYGAGLPFAQINPNAYGSSLIVISHPNARKALLSSPHPTSCAAHT